MVDALIGAEAGIVAIWCTIPLEKMQQKSATERDEHGKPKPYLRIAGEILREKGITAFWNGIDVLTVSVFFEKGKHAVMRLYHRHSAHHKTGFVHRHVFRLLLGNHEGGESNEPILQSDVRLRCRAVPGAIRIPD